MGTHGRRGIHGTNHGCGAIVIAGWHEKTRFGQLSGMTRLVALELLVIATVVGVAAENSKQHNPCQVNPTTFDGWNAEELANPCLELVIVPQLGGRLMQVTFAGHPYLFVNPKYKG